MNKRQQRKLAKTLYDEEHEEGIVKKQGSTGLLVWMIAFTTACDHIKKRDWFNRVVTVVGYVTLMVFLLIILFGGDINIKLNLYEIS